MIVDKPNPSTGELVRGRSVGHSRLIHFGAGDDALSARDPPRGPDGPLDRLTDAELARDYASLKAEAKYLAGLSQAAFLQMARRLLIIRDRKLYREDGYSSFREFVDEELPISRSTVYNVMDIAVYFGVHVVQSSGQGSGTPFEYSKLIPALPLLKCSQPSVPRKAIADDFLRRAPLCSVRELVRLSQELKAKYGVTTRASSATRRLRAVLTSLKRSLPLRPSMEESSILREMMHTLHAALGGLADPSEEAIDA